MQIAMQVLNALFYELPLDELQNFRDRVNAVTVDDIQRVARTYLQPDRLSVVLVGNAAAFASQLRGRRVRHSSRPSSCRTSISPRPTSSAPKAADHGAAGAGCAAEAAQSRRRSGATTGRLPSSRRRDRAGGRRADGDGRERAARSRDRGEGRRRRAARASRSIKAVSTRAGQTPNGAGDGRRRRRTSSTRTACASRRRFPTRRSCRCSTASTRWVRDPAGVHDLPAEAVRADPDQPQARHDCGARSPAHDGALHARLLPDVKTAGRRASAGARAVERRTSTR